MGFYFSFFTIVNARAFIIFIVLLCLGFDEGQCHCFSRCCCLLSRVKCYSFYSKCWKCTSFNTFIGANNATEYNGHSTSSWNIKRTANHFGNNAGNFRCTHMINIYTVSWMKKERRTHTEWNANWFALNVCRMNYKNSILQIDKVLKRPKITFWIQSIRLFSKQIKESMKHFLRKRWLRVLFVHFLLES